MSVQQVRSRFEIKYGSSIEDFSFRTYYRRRREAIDVARQESGARKLEGHDIMALGHFDPEVTHMIVLDVLSRESPIEDKDDRMRLFLTEARYKKALEDQGRSFIQILNHAKASQGHLQYDRPDEEQ